MARAADIRVVGLNRVLRALRQFPKEAGAELRKESQNIAERRMLPAWKNAAMYNAGPWGAVLAADIKVRRDRVPAVRIGSNTRRFSGGASTNRIRYVSDKGSQGLAGDATPPAFGSGLDWMSTRQDYRLDAMRDWTEALDRVIRRWDSM
jgi:hypothetical protein